MAIFKSMPSIFVAQDHTDSSNLLDFLSTDFTFIFLLQQVWQLSLFGTFLNTIAFLLEVLFVDKWCQTKWLCQNKFFKKCQSLEGRSNKAVCTK